MILAVTIVLGLKYLIDLITTFKCDMFISPLLVVLLWNSVFPLAIIIIIVTLIVWVIRFAELIDN